MITDEMVEKAACVLCLRNAQPDCYEPGSCVDTGCQQKGRDFLEDARAVLEAVI